MIIVTSAVWQESVAVAQDINPILKQRVSSYSQYYTLPWDVKKREEAEEGFKKVFAKGAMIEYEFDDRVSKNIDVYIGDLVGFFNSDREKDSASFVITSDDILYSCGSTNEVIIRKTFLTYKKGMIVKSKTGTVVLSFDDKSFLIKKVKRIDDFIFTALDANQDSKIDSCENKIAKSKPIPEPTSKPKLSPDKPHPDAGRDKKTPTQTEPVENKKAASRLNFNIAGGVFFQQNSLFTASDRVEGKAWPEEGQFARKLGYVGDASLQYNFAKFFALDLGVLYLSAPFSSEHFAEQIKYFLVSNNVVVRSADVTSNGYRFIVPYLGICVGSFRSDKAVWSAELLGGSASSVGDNSVSANINYQSYPAQQSTISLKSGSFFMMGLKLKGDFKVTETSRITLSLFGLGGQPKIMSQPIMFADIPGSIRLSGGTMLLTGGALGWSWRLVR